MFLQPLDLTTALRPFLLPDESLLFVQDVVGLYEGPYKIPNLQNGHAYLTTHRVCYVDNLEPRKNSVAVELKNVDRLEFYAGFFKSSAKVTLHPKSTLGSSIRSYSNASSTQTSSSSLLRNASPFQIERNATGGTTPSSGSSTPRPSSATWVCTICSFANPVPSNFDPVTANVNMVLAACLSCGIKPSFAHVMKAAIASAAGRANSGFFSQTPMQSPWESQFQSVDDASITNTKTKPYQASDETQGPTLQCPRCTFQNHPSLLVCEICGLSLTSMDPAGYQNSGPVAGRPESPGPVLNGSKSVLENTLESIKFSFRAGGEKVFHERLKGAMIQRKWLLQNAPPVPDAHQVVAPGQRNAYGADGQPRPSAQRARTVGIAGLERQGLELRLKNEAVIGSAFEDLDALMASAKEIVALAETFAKKSENGSADANQIIAESAEALDMVITKDMLGSSSGSESLYLSEMSRNLAEFLTDDAKGILRKEGGIMSLVDLWAIFNRARGGVELISPMEFEKAARLWEKLRLPVRLRQFKNGLLVVQQADRTDDKTIAELLAWLNGLHVTRSLDDGSLKAEAFGRGITAQEAAYRFGWSVGVASEELEMAEERGALCREEGVEGLRFWENWIVHDHSDKNVDDGIKCDPIIEVDPIQKNLEDMGLF